jgi:hypothetical protein
MFFELVRTSVIKTLKKICKQFFGKNSIATVGMICNHMPSLSQINVSPSIV